MQYLTILGSTGSIGTSTITVVKQNTNKFTIQALVAHTNVALMTEQCLLLHPVYACMTNTLAAKKLKTNLIAAGESITVLAGYKAACELAVLDEVDIVMAAITGAAGLKATLAAIQAGKKVLLANKESLVICGKIFMQEARRYHAQLLPVDSEHNAIFQSLPKKIQQNLGYASLKQYGVSSIILTGSGGPFLHTKLSNLSTITPKQACIHPNWSMGHKISVDCATMMNKGLEYIEARWLFNATPNQLEILLHPQSIIHGMVRYIDGSILAQLYLPNMCTPIAYAMAYPERISTNIKQLDFLSLGVLSFEKPDYLRYPCLKLAIEASELGQAATIILNAANEIAVSAFLNKKIRFTDIATINLQVQESLNLAEPNSIEEIIFIDQQAREKTRKNINRYDC